MPADRLLVQDPEFWRRFRLGGSIILGDPQAVEDAARRGQGAFAQPYQVDKIIRVRERQGAAEWYFYHLVDPDQDLWFMVKIVGDDAMDLRVYFQPAGFEPGNRRDMIDGGNLWLFLPPDDPDNFEYNDLEYTEEVGPPIAEHVFRLKSQKTMYGSAWVNPRELGLEDPTMAAIAEYSTEYPETDNPEFLILEIGETEAGGLIKVLLGTSISPNYVDALNR